MSTSAQTTKKKKAEASVPTTRYLGFVLADREFAVRVTAAREILPMPPISPLPRMPEEVSGIINLRGKIVPVVDLRPILRLPKGELTDRSCVIVIEFEREDVEAPMQMGCIVESVNEVLAIRHDHIDPPPRLGGDVDVRFLQGIARLDDGKRVVGLLDSNGLLGSIGGVALDPEFSES